MVDPGTCQAHGPLIESLAEIKSDMREVKGHTTRIIQALHGVIGEKSPGLISDILDHGRRLDTLEDQGHGRTKRGWDVLIATLPWIALVLLYAAAAWHQGLKPGP